jgi:hypothetical protein
MMRVKVAALCDFPKSWYTYQHEAASGISKQMKLIARFRKWSLPTRIGVVSALCGFATTPFIFFPVGESSSAPSIDRSPAAVVQNAVNSPNAVQVAGSINIHAVPPVPRWVLAEKPKCEYDAGTETWKTHLLFSTQPKGHRETAEIRVTFDRPFLKAHTSIITPPPDNVHYPKFEPRIENDSRTYHCGQQRLVEGSSILLDFESVEPLTVQLIEFPNDPR